MAKHGLEDSHSVSSVHDLLIRSSEGAINIQRSDGSFPPGRNGVYQQAMTPVRSTAKWLIVLCQAYKLDGREGIKEAANNAIEYLLSEEARPHKYTFKSRSAEDATKCNGLVGQGPPIRALVRAGETFEQREPIEVAKDVFATHPFDSHTGLWEIVEIDGSYHSIDRTLNHQLIFASAAAELGEHSQTADALLESFLDNLSVNMGTRKNGLPYHYIQPHLRTVLSSIVDTPRYYPLAWNAAISVPYRFSPAREKKELGYYPTIALQLAQLKAQYPQNAVWHTERMAQVLNLLDEYETLASTHESLSFGAPIPEFNLAVARNTFSDQNDMDMEELQRAINRCFDPKSNLLTRNAVDPMLQARAVSHLVDLPDLTFPH